MSELGDDIAGCALDLVRSLWAELGAGDAPRRHEWQALDLEPLIVFTAFFSPLDARLRYRTIDWCAANGRHVSGLRLHRFASRSDPAIGRAVARYVATIVSVTKEAANRESRSMPAPDLGRPALIQLRLRAVVGVSARAEVLRLLLADPERPRTASSLVVPAGYGRRGLRQALEMLTMAGITTVEPAGAQRLYRLSRPAELAQALRGLPSSFPDWWAAFRVIEAILRYARGAGEEPARRVAAAVRLLEEVHDELQHWPAAGRPPRIAGRNSIAAFDGWAREFVAGQAHPGGGAEAPAREVAYTVHRLLVGGWIATVREAGEQPRPLALSDDPELRPDRRAHRRLGKDDAASAAGVIETMLIDIKMRDLQRSQGSLVPRRSVADSLIPALSRVFAAELLMPLEKGQSATFTEDFLQRWFSSRRDRFSEAG